MINICIFEDNGYQQLAPITFNKPSFDCRVGASSLADKIILAFSNSNVSLHCRDYLAKVTKQTYKGLLVNRMTGGSNTLFLNGRLCLDQAVFEIITDIDKHHNLILTHRGSVIALYLDIEAARNFGELLKEVPSTATIIHYFHSSVVIQEIPEAKVINYPWDLISYQDAMIENDFLVLNQPGVIKGSIGTLASLQAEDKIYIGEHSVIENFAYIDAKKGPVIIEDHVTICANSTLRGPLYIGSHSVIAEGSIVKNSSIGAHCKIGGEVNHSIFHSHSNKVHHGYIGHSYVGQWVNLAAGTSNSNLKLNYKPVKVSFKHGSIDSQTQFLGCYLGDHCKTTIHTQITCGTVVGFGSCLLGSDSHKGYIPEFSWGNSGDYQAHIFDQFIQTVREVMSRRKIRISDDIVALYQLLYQHQSTEAPCVQNPAS